MMQACHLIFSSVHFVHLHYISLFNLYQILSFYGLFMLKRHFTPSYYLPKWVAFAM